MRWLELVIAVVVDNLSLSCIERRYRLDDGKGLHYLKAGLERYPGFGETIRPGDEF